MAIGLKQKKTEFLKDIRKRLGIKYDAFEIHQINREELEYLIKPTRETFNKWLASKV